jgi:hypothetical protein
MDRLGEDDEHAGEGLGSEEGQVAMVIEDEFEHAGRSRAYDRWQIRGEVIDEAREVQEFERQLERWSGSCVVCRMGLRLGEGEETYHEMAQCPHRDDESWH